MKALLAILAFSTQYAFANPDYIVHKLNYISCQGKQVQTGKPLSITIERINSENYQATINGQEVEVNLNSFYVHDWYQYSYFNIEMITLYNVFVRHFSLVTPLSNNVYFDIVTDSKAVDKTKEETDIWGRIFGDSYEVEQPKVTVATYWTQAQTFSSYEVPSILECNKVEFSEEAAPQE